MIRSDLKKHEYLDLLKALSHLPIFLSIGIIIMVLSVFSITVSVGFATGEFNKITSTYVLIAGIIEIFITFCFTLILCEILSGKMRADCLKKMNDKEIQLNNFSNNILFTVKAKIGFFLSLFLLTVFLSNLLLYHNKENLNRVWTFSFFAFLTSLFLAYILFYTIYISLKQIENASYKLIEGGKGVLFLRSLDKEFITVAKGINKASVTIQDYRNSLENKVKDRTKKLNEAVTELQMTLAELNHKEELLETELEFAANIQKGIIPAEIKPYSGLQFAVFYEPLGKVSGDYYDIFRFPSCIYVIMADASGHGVPAALITMAAKHVFSNIQENDRPSEIFKMANRELLKRIKTSDYLTAFLLRIDEKHRIQYSNASHTKAIHYHKNTNNLELLDTNGMFIAAIDEAEYLYEDRTTRLNSGDRIYLYTDGLIEHKSLNKEEFGQDRLNELILSTIELPCKSQLEEIRLKLHKHIGTAPLTDDISMLIIELPSFWTKFIELYNNGLKLLKENHIEYALKLFEEAKILFPSYPSIYYQIALALYQLKEYEKSIEYLHIFLDKKPDEIKALQLAVNVYSKLGMKEKAKRTLKRIRYLENIPDSNIGI